MNGSEAVQRRADSVRSASCDKGALRMRGFIGWRLLLLVGGGVVLGLAVWNGMKSLHSDPVRTRVTVHRNLMKILPFAEYVQTTERMNPGLSAGKRFTVEANPSDGEQVVGVISRSDERPPFAWLIGQRPGFFLDVVEPSDRVLSLTLASATDAPQQVRVLFNGHKLESKRLRSDRQYMTIQMPVSADLQASGRNRVQLDFSGVQQQRLEGEELELPVAGALRLVRFLAPAAETQLDEAVETRESRLRPGVRTISEANSNRSELMLPAGSNLGLALQLPPSERVVLRMALPRLDLPMELWAQGDNEDSQRLLRVDPEHYEPGTVDVDLSEWSGKAVRLDVRVPEGEGRVSIYGMALLVPEGSEHAEHTALTEEQPLRGQLEVLRDGDLPRLAWTQGGLRLVVDVASRSRRLFDLNQDPGGQRDVSYTRKASVSLLSQELQRAVHDREEVSHASGALRQLNSRP
ncbi:MAG: hypothetical protein P8N09_06790 [Planctomycetota bacterium]|jgi:hypothetical protein|nr:hypothetical protein [Planctomycetota bacterium]